MYSCTIEDRSAQDPRLNRPTLYTSQDFELIQRVSAPGRDCRRCVRDGLLAQGSRARCERRIQGGERPVAVRAPLVGIRVRGRRALGVEDPRAQRKQKGRAVVASQPCALLRWAKPTGRLLGDKAGAPLEQTGRIPLLVEPVLEREHDHRASKDPWAPLRGRHLGEGRHGVLAALDHPKVEHALEARGRVGRAQAQLEPAVVTPLADGRQRRERHKDTLRGCDGELGAVGAVADAQSARDAGVGDRDHRQRHADRVAHQSMRIPHEYVLQDSVAEAVQDVVVVDRRRSCGRRREESVPQGALARTDREVAQCSVKEGFVQKGQVRPLQPWSHERQHGVQRDRRAQRIVHDHGANVVPVQKGQARAYVGVDQPRRAECEDLSPRVRAEGRQVLESDVSPLDMRGKQRYTPEPFEGARRRSRRTAEQRRLPDRARVRVRVQRAALRHHQRRLRTRVRTRVESPMLFNEYKRKDKKDTVGSS
jgi:hypothetical protein